ncbi:hypothetical protein N6H05_09610 [Sphingobium sp. WTD-1]|uniref:hypothetical protein n=1 Tax=Sphingobium sp. WTD-1 TaxID=2979467 RepID=UPI0024DE5C3B|nr:hypothetical protein [Sphingobium sp. WTD-1]WIA58026.1 hypothetical protein N6H05_09610 [Sphingobium sp. WTD-1]
METETIEAKINLASDTFAKSIDAMATGGFVRDGVLKQAVVSVIWALFREMPDQRDALADVLDEWTQTIKEAALEEERRAGAE